MPDLPRWRQLVARYRSIDLEFTFDMNGRVRGVTQVPPGEAPMVRKRVTSSMAIAQA
jgi:hypothetical protein